MLELTQRDKEILEILISDYIATASPVGSRVIAKRHPRHLSAATIRNVMADLEEMGLLTQPHASSGRVPTSLGMRYYVDVIIKKREIDKKEMRWIREKCGEANESVTDLIKKTARVLSTISNYAGLVVAPRSCDFPLKYVEFVRLGRGRLLGILVTTVGEVQNRIVEINEELSDADLEKINSCTRELFEGLTLVEAMRKLKKDIENSQLHYDRLLSKALLWIGEMLEHSSEAEIFVEGESRLLNEPEFADIDKLKQIFEALEEKKCLLNVLEKTMAGEGVKIFIGSEAGISCMDNCSVITASYRDKDKILGTIGVIGPMRMDYSKVIPVVDFTSKVLSDLLGGVYDRDEEEGIRQGRER